MEGREGMKEGRERRWCYLEAGINNQGGRGGHPMLMGALSLMSSSLWTIPNLPCLLI